MMSNEIRLDKTQFRKKEKKKKEKEKEKINRNI
jgi:hypothetical protein